MKTFEELFRAARADKPEHITNDLLVKAAGEFWNAQVQAQFEWFETGRAQNLALLKGLLEVAKAYRLLTSTWHPDANLHAIIAEVEEVLKNEEA